MVATSIDTRLTEYVPSRIWLKKYAVHYAGADFFARATFIRLNDGNVLVHSPSPIDDALVEQVRKIGPVAHIVAPGSYHYFYVSAWQEAFPDAMTWICPGVERKCPDLGFDWFLSDRSPEVWADQLDQVLVRGNRFIWEVAFFDRASRTLILTDLIENIGDQTEGTDWVLKLWWKAVMHMWDKPRPAPEYQMGWKERAAARRSLKQILEWDFDRIVIAHGDNIESDAKAVAREAWAKPLSFED
jgi:hypothetical protein